MHSLEANPTFVLASSSKYRKEQLAKLIPRFESLKPDVDETPGEQEHPKALAMRLSKDKCVAVIPAKSNSIIIGSDQTAACDSVLLSKPGTKERAQNQLALCSGKAVTFYTALCVYLNGEFIEDCDQTTVKFRQLSREEIERYIDLERPLDCAGSFKCEGLGISLFESISTDDPSALIGLPTIALNKILLRLGVNVLALPHLQD